MTTLSQAHIAQLLARLHEQAEATDAPLLQEMQDRMGGTEMTIEDAAAKMIADEGVDYRRVYSGYADRFLAVSPNYGRFLYAMARAAQAKRIVEFGSSMGVSTIYLAAALRDNGGGQLIGAELEPTKAARARSHLEEAGLLDLVDIREGDALDTLKNIDGEVDLALIDGGWSLYLPVLKLIEPRLRPGALVLGENAFVRDYLDYVREPVNGYIAHTLPIDEGRGNEFAVKVA
ncbi:O-methyltransferase [Methylobacterium sp. R2-1]|uniref:O-methyltransferase n=1 Tax=Methylobacterium sp. R2-1 TaxID=2587064 RepID=UPI0016111DD9|nr:class I SAM-dependent methyltransferase [Methylobacterium sp. R2-1]MBB2964770.1 putative O-methyltransferase YrrM [Methylobacterium sp. R2-1]